MNEKIELVLSTYKDKKGVLVDLLNKERKEERIKIRTKEWRISINNNEIQELKELLKNEVESNQNETIEKLETEMKKAKTKKKKLEIMKNIPWLSWLFEEAGV